jgi:hypothetical protein
VGNRDIRREAIARLAAAQHGVFSRKQAIEAGFHPSAIDRRVNTRAWEPVDRAVYRVTGTPPGWRQRLMAACLAGPAIASHRSAAALLGFVDCDRDLIEVTALRHRRRRSSEVVWHESCHFETRDLTVVDGITTTRPLRTVLDLGVVVGVNRLEELFDDGLRRGWYSTHAVWTRWEELGGVLRPGGLVLEAVLERKTAGTRPVGSLLESRFLQLVSQAGLRHPVAQYEVHDGDELVARVDFAYPELKLAIELDGEERHAGRSPRKSDARRERRLVRLGYRVLRFHWDDIRRTPGDVAREIADFVPRSA